MAATTQRTSGAIEPGAVYRLEDFLARVGWSHHAWRSARAAGMKSVRMHARCYVRGDDFMRYVDQVASRAEPASV